jgi:predicted transposase YbfD/YdcC
VADHRKSTALACRSGKLVCRPDQPPQPGFGKIQTDFRTTRHVNKGHGRLEIRALQASSLLNAYLAWPGLQQGQVYKTSCEIEYGVTSLSAAQASPQKLLQLRRQPWRIETGLHYRREVTFKEEATRTTKGTAGKILATIHNLVLALIKRAGFTHAAKARRWFAGHLADVRDSS